jgi:signal peptidase I
VEIRPEFEPVQTGDGDRGRVGASGSADNAGFEAAGGAAGFGMVDAPGFEAADAANAAGFEAADADEPVGGPARTRPRAFGCLFEIVETLVLTLIVFFVIQTFIAQPYQVKGDSMERTFETGQYVLVDKLTPRFTGYHRGDVVVLDPPTPYRQADNEPFIKRVIGLPGDTVKISGGRVYVNGTALDEPYTYDGQPTVPEGRDTWVVEPGHYLVLGDHRGASADSRVFGTITSQEIIGRAWLRYWPLSTIGIVSTPSYAPVPSATPGSSTTGTAATGSGSAAGSGSAGSGSGSGSAVAGSAAGSGSAAAAP